MRISKYAINIFVFLSFVVLFTNGCTAKDTIDNDPTFKGYILNIERGTVLVVYDISEEKYNQIKDQSLREIGDNDEYIPLIYLNYDNTNNLKKGHEVNVWIDGVIDHSYPQQALAKKIKAIENVDNKPPIPKVTLDGEELPVVLSSYHWKDEVNLNVNYDELIENIDTFDINSESEINIDYLVNNTKPEHLSYGFVWKENDYEDWISYSNYPREVKNRTIKINGMEEYIESIILYLNATWDSGKKAKYVIPILNK